MKSLLSFVFTVLCSYLIAQPTIERANMITLGSKMDIAVGGSVNPGKAGANQTWDFSTHKVSPGGSISFVDPKNTPFSSLVKDANFTYKISLPTGNRYIYFKMSDTKFEQLLNNFDSSANFSKSSYLDDPKIDFTFPMKFKDSIADSWKRGDGVTGTSIRVYDGYGTLKTPYGTYDSVIRIKSMSGGGPWSYNWYHAKPFYPIFSLDNENNTTFCLTKIVTSTKDDVASVKARISVYPNPVNGILNINTINNLKNIKSVYVRDMIGRISMVLPTQTTSINTESLSDGVYFLIVDSQEGHATEKFVVKH